jgi:hypothetical protein
MNKYTSPGFRTITAESIAAAAEKIAAVAARRKFGRSGCVGSLQVLSYAQDMSLVEYQAFIGFSSGRNQTTGNNIHFTVYSR